MPQLLELQTRRPATRIAINELRPTRRLTNRRRALRQTDEAVELSDGADGAQPDVAIFIEFREDAVFEVFDSTVASLAGFFEGTDVGGEGGDVPSCSSLRSR